ncbi:MAG: hypothetical protein K6F09_06360, partial [Clostridiales bacterium]|nr:hypothetical protein [Clostridiales bacterium]
MERNRLLVKKTPQRIRHFYGADDGLPSSSVLCLALDGGGNLFVGTEKGAAYFKNDGFEKIKGIKGSVKKLLPLKNGNVFAVSENTVYTLADKKVKEKHAVSDDITDICIDGVGNVRIIAGMMMYKLKDNKFLPEKPLEFTGSTAMTAYGDSRVYVISPDALHILHGKRPHWGNVMPCVSDIPTTDVSSLTSDEWGHVWFASKKGAYVFDGKSTWLSNKEIETLPSCNVKSITFTDDGEVLYCTDIGLYIQSGTKYSFLGANRWLPSSNV